MFDNIKPVSLHCVFHGIRFKVNEDWVSGIDTLLFYIVYRPFFKFLFPERKICSVFFFHSLYFLFLGNSPMFTFPFLSMI